MRVGTEEASKERMGPTPLLPSSSERQNESASQPIGVRRPNPVMTARRDEAGMIDHGRSAPRRDAEPPPGVSVVGHGCNLPSSEERGGKLQTCPTRTSEPAT